MEISCAEVFVISPAAQYAQQRSSLVLRISKNCTQHAFFGQTISLFSSWSQVAELDLRKCRQNIQPLHPALQPNASSDFYSARPSAMKELGQQRNAM